MKSLLPLLLAASLLAAEPPADDLRKLDARELHNRGTRRLAEGDLAGAEEALRASLGRDIDDLRPPRCITSGTYASVRASRRSAARRPRT